MGRIIYDQANEVKPDPDTIYPNQDDSSDQCSQDRSATDTISTNQLLNDKGALQSHLAEHGKISHTAYGVFDLPASEDIFDSIKEGTYSGYLEEDFITLAISFQSEAEWSPDTGLVTVSNDILYEPRENTDRASQVLSEYNMFIVPGDNVFATKSWRLPEGQEIGFPIEAGKGGRIKLSTDLTQTLVEREASLYIVDSERQQLGRLVVNFLGPPGPPS